jgi:hypothetical protein
MYMKYHLTVLIISAVAHASVGSPNGANGYVMPFTDAQSI